MTRPFRFKLLIGSLALMVLGLGAWSLAAARGLDAPAQQASPIHPTFALLDADGNNVLTSQQAVSTMQTCGACHDAAFIESHSFHADLGLDDYGTPQAATAIAWNASTGLFGKFDPLTYRYLSQVGDERIDLTTPDWLMTLGARVPGGGPATTSRNGLPLTTLGPNASDPETATRDPQTGELKPWNWAESGTLEMNCFVCHLTQPNNDARVAAIQAGKFGEASTATLIGTGIVEQQGGWVYNPAAFDASGELKREFVMVQDPTNHNCATCHGEVHTQTTEPLLISACDLDYPQTATTGQIIAPQKVSASGVNISDKAAANHSWDIHAERQLKCTDCHYALNNPVHAQEAASDRPGHLVYDPRKLEIGEYLKMPDHNFARGQSAQFSIAPDLKGTMRRCESCHDASATHANWLPYTDQHMAVVACESCHVAQLHAPAIEAYDWTVIRADGGAVDQCRGIEGGRNTVTNLVTGYQPVLMQRTNIDGQQLLAPYNLITSWFWIYDDAAGRTRPVPQADLQAVFLSNGRHAPEIVQAFDANGDQALSDAELRVDTDAKRELIANRLAGRGLKNPRITGQVQPYSINHNVTRGNGAINNCQSCHSDSSRVAAPLQLSAYVPGGVLPQFVPDTNVNATGEISRLSDGSLTYQPVTMKDGVYVFGRDRVAWIDVLGALAFVGALAGVAGHGTLRYLSTMRRPKGKAHTKPVYMYESYERFWHWLQTVSIVLLLFTGLIIHRPDLFGAFAFRNVVTIHNILAVILIVNAALSLFWHVTNGQIRQYVPRPVGFFDDAIVQAKYYIRGIFKGEPHPFEKRREKKLNPLQQATYFGLLNVLLPLQMITGALMWGVQQWPDIANFLGGLPVLAPFHSLIAWLLAAFIVGHVYLTTTGATPVEAMRGMITGWEEIEAHEHEEPIEKPEQPATPAAPDTAAQSA